MSLDLKGGKKRAERSEVRDCSGEGRVRSQDSKQDHKRWSWSKSRELREKTVESKHNWRGLSERCFHVMALLGSSDWPANANCIISSKNRPRWNSQEAVV